MALELDVDGIRGGGGLELCSQQQDDEQRGDECVCDGHCALMVSVSVVSVSVVSVGEKDEVRGR